MKEAEREVRKAQENLEKEKKKILKQRRIRTSAPRVFNDDELDKTLKELRFERGKEEESGARRKVRRLKKGSCSSSLGDDSLFAGQPLVKGSSKQQSSEKMKKEKLLRKCQILKESSTETQRLTSERR